MKAKMMTIYPKTTWQGEDPEDDCTSKTTSLTENTDDHFSFEND